MRPPGQHFKDPKNKAAVMIQKVWRGKQARDELAYWDYYECAAVSPTCPQRLLRRLRASESRLSDPAAPNLE